MSIKNGSQVKDIYTGYEGIVMARTEYLYGCTQVLIVPLDLDKDGKRLSGEWFDEQRIETIKKKAPKKSKESKAKTGGPQADVPDTSRL